MTTEKKPKKERAKRAKGTPQPAIKWFQDAAAETKDTEEITARAKAEKYSPSTISIQIGRLRGMGLLPEKPKAEKKEKERAVRAVPKPSKKSRQAAATASAA